MNIQVILIAVLAMATVGLLVFAAMPRKTAVHDRVAQLGGSTSSNAKRILVFEQIYDAKAKGKLQQRLLEAGLYNVTPGLIGFVTFAGVAAGIAIALFLIFVLHEGGLMMLLAIALPIIFYVGPSRYIDSAIKKRKTLVQSELPDFLDMVSSTVAAGIALNGALLSAVDMSTGPLGDEFRATLADIRMGRARSDALNSMATRVNQVDLTQMVTAIVQSERVGGNISQVLEELAHEARERRLMRAEELAGILPLKMTLPMALFLLPALFVMIFGPVVANMKL